MPAFEDKIPFYDRRRSLRLPVGLPRSAQNWDVKLPHLQPMLSTSGIRELIESDDMQIPAPDDREGYFADRHIEYWLSGYYDAVQVTRVIDALGSTTGAARCLDFGGCSGRVARHLARVERHEIWLCDITAIYIDWLDQYSTRKITAFQNKPQPTLPFEASTFDCVCAFSVFSHIAEGELHWLLELKRIIRPGGALYISILDDSSWAYARKQNWLLDSLARGTEDERLRRDVVDDLPTDRYILRYSANDAYNCNVFYRRAFVERKWLPLFSSSEVVPHGHAYQTCLILRK